MLTGSKDPLRSIILISGRLLKRIFPSEEDPAIRHALSEKLVIV